VGLAAVFALTRLMASLLYDVKPTEKRASRGSAQLAPGSPDGPEKPQICREFARLSWIRTEKRYDSKANAMTQSEVPGAQSTNSGVIVIAGALSIGAFERRLWRLRRTRQLWVLNRV
jgi:hypothetical protein